MNSQIPSPQVTPLDVIKTRLQTQQKTMLSNKCFVYCNGLMDHLCPCAPSGNRALSTSSTSAASMNMANQSHYKGTVVRERERETKFKPMLRINVSNLSGF